MTDRPGGPGRLACSNRPRKPVLKTYAPKPEHIERRWYVVDASGQVLGRLASEVAALLRGKHKPIYAPHMDTGDNVIVVNAEKIELTGSKETKKVAYRHSGYPGGITGTRYDRLRAERPTFVIEKAVRGMLPKNRLGRAMIRKLHVVAGPEHPHQAQQPVAYTLGRPPVWEGLPTPRAQTTPAPQEPAPKAKRASAARPKTSAAAKPAAKEPAAKKAAAAKPKPAAAKPAARKSAATSTARTRTAASKPAAKKAPKAGEES